MKYISLIGLLCFIFGCSNNQKINTDKVLLENKDSSNTGVISIDTQNFEHQYDSIITIAKQSLHSDSIKSKKLKKRSLKDKDRIVLKPIKSKEQMDEKALIAKMKEKALSNKGKADWYGTKDGWGEGKGSAKGSGEGNGGLGSNSGGENKKYSHSLAGRKLTLFQSSNDCNAEGKVIVDILVKPDGTVKPLKISPASKNTNQCLNQLAMKIAGKSKFNAIENTESIEGTITIYFEF